MSKRRKIPIKPYVKAREFTAAPVYQEKPKKSKISTDQAKLLFGKFPDDYSDYAEEFQLFITQKSFGPVYNKFIYKEDFEEFTEKVKDPEYREGLHKLKPKQIEYGTIDVATKDIPAEIRMRIMNEFIDGTNLEIKENNRIFEHYSKKPNYLNGILHFAFVYSLQGSTISIKQQFALRNGLLQPGYELNEFIEHIQKTQPDVTEMQLKPKNKKWDLIMQKMPGWRKQESWYIKELAVKKK